VWLILLSIFHEKSTPLVDIFDLKDQNVIRKSCGEFVSSSISSDNEEATQSKLETLLTTYYKRNGEENITEEGLAAHLQLLKPFLTLSIDDADAYRLFKTVLTHYIPRDVGNPQGLPFHIFRLILLYHEPEVCNVLDSLRIKGHDFAHSWVRKRPERIGFGLEINPKPKYSWNLEFSWSFFTLFLVQYIVERRCIGSRNGASPLGRLLPI